MHKIHNSLMERGGRYAKWHNNPYHQFVQWLVLVVVSVSVGTFILNRTNQLDPLSYSAASFVASQQTSNSVNATTGELLQAIKDYIKTKATEDPDATASALAKVSSVASMRQAALIDLAEKNPNKASLSLLPQSLLETFPKEIQSLLESPSAITGNLAVYHLDRFQENTSEFVYELALTDGSAETLRLFLLEERPDLTSGQTVKVKGYKIGSKAVFAEAGKGGVQVAAAGAGGSSTGAQKAIVVLMNFQDNQSQPITQVQAADMVFNNPNSSNKFYQENSFSKLSFSGVATPWVTIPKSSSTCDVNSWASAADSAVKALGYSVGNYQKIIYFFPRTSCGWTGYGQIGGNPSRSWINGSAGWVIDHELGHNIGLHHAASLSCGSLVVDDYSRCSFSEYGDPNEVLAVSGQYHFNAAHKIAANWLGSTQVQTVTSNGTFTLSPIETATSDLKALKINKPDTSDAYYIDYRQPFGFDSNISSNAQGASIHIWSGYPGSQTKALDASPDGNFGSSVLTDGASFTDPALGITITQISHSSTGVVVSVSFGPATCTRSQPTVSISPSTQNASAGQILNYNISVLNNNSYGCGTSTFNLSALVPSGFTGTISPANLTLGYKAGGIANLSVASPQGTADGVYTVSAKVTDSADAGVSNSASASYVAFTDSIGPTVAITAPSSGSTVSGGFVTITVSATDNLAVKKVEIYVDDVLQVTDTTAPYTYKWALRKASSGTHTISAKAYDLAGNVGTASISVTK